MYVANGHMRLFLLTIFVDRDEDGFEFWHCLFGKALDYVAIYLLAHGLLNGD